MERKTITELYVRVCHDMRHDGDFDRAAKLVAGALKIHPLEVLNAVGFDNMQRISRGESSSVQRL